MEKSQCIEDGDNEAASVIAQILHRLYDVILANPEYKNIPEIYISIGTEEERDNNITTAIELYKEAI
jgi:hypothetical protein